MSVQLHPNGFRISERPVAASFAHAYSFQPLPDNVYPDETCLPSSLGLGGVEGTWVKYWDENSTVAVMEFKVEEAAEDKTAAIAAAAAAKAKKEKERKKAKGTWKGLGVDL